MKKKPDEDEPLEPSADEPPPRTAGDVMSESLRAKLQLTQDASAKAGLADLAKSFGAVPDSGLADLAKPFGAVPGGALAASIGELKAASELSGSNLAAGFGALKVADFSNALGESQRRWAGLIDQAAQSSKVAHELADFRMPESQLSEHLWDDTQVPMIVRPDPLPAMSAELSRVGGLVAVMADNVGMMAALGQSAEKALLRLELEASQTRDETERLRGALEKGQHSAEWLAKVSLFATGVLVVLTVVIAALTAALVLRGG